MRHHVGHAGTTRWPLAFWNFLFAPRVGYAAKPGHDAVWNRGAYLVQGPGHCGACHTPRGIGLQEKALDDSSANFLAGAELDAWYAPSLCGDMRTGLGTWSTKDIGEFLKHGHNRVGSTFGSMTDVINNSTSYFSDSDIDAIAVYLKSLPARSAQQAVAYDNATTDALRNSPTTQPGAAICRAIARAVTVSTPRASPRICRLSPATPSCLTRMRHRSSMCC